MTEGPGRTRLLWRRRRHPLSRRIDVAEAWIVLIAGVLLVIGSPLLGVASGAVYHQDLVRQRHERLPTAAVLLEDADRPASQVTEEYPSSSHSTRVRAEVRWTDAAGVERTGKTQVRAGLRAGASATIWTADGGRHAVPAPPTPGQAVTRGITLGVCVALMYALLLVLVLVTVRLSLERRRADWWEREWARVGGTC
ncbi:hypothetical protein G5C51_01690 [Streptomyces sp. A7024]|uniref:Transmembrane protein n=1 Tax=Streptomyces coryli TaxID=1128680 RepID=A0A6G4TU42_9ACTN|nr:hypothetical protein [Streptomyces coryli]NGN62618.1 hypothetical protein [Streptomyces coryli]